MEQNALWRIELFGGLRAGRGEQRITRFPSRKAAALLAYLAYFQNRTHGREALIERIWPECEPSAGRGRLATLLTFLRHLLEPPGIAAGTVLQADRLTVRLNPAALTTDVVEFERLFRAVGEEQERARRIVLLERAVALYQGDLLPEYYDDWIAREQAKLSERYADALEQLSVEQAQEGDWEAALEASQRALQADPYREEACRAVMRLQAALGRSAAGLETYRALEQALKAEMNARPAPPTQELAEMLRSNPAAVARALPSRSAPTSTPVSAATREKPLANAVEANSETIPLMLPLTLSRYFGRQAEIERLAQMLRPTCPSRRGGRDRRLPSAGADSAEGEEAVGDERLVTLTGPGGAGKTRLSVEVARWVASAYRNRVWFVALADVPDPLFLPNAIVSALQIAPAPHANPLERLIEALGTAPSLLVLDNLEHLLDDPPISAPANQAKSQRGMALMLRLLLERLPLLKCLVTSRRNVGIGGEREFPVPTLTVPVSPLPPERLMEYASIALYVDRAQAVRPDFALTENNASSVVALCRRLEGIPLAIEMAAGWAKQLTPARMLERLETQLDLLVSRRSDVSARHRSLRATISWSYDLLSPDLQFLFAALAVFRGGWTLEAAESIVARENVIEPLAYLQEYSLILTEERAGEIRFRMLETLREYAQEQLDEPAREALQRRHAAFYLTLAESAEPHLHGDQQKLWMARLESERENLNRALAWSLEYDLETGMRLAGALSWFWHMHGYAAEGLQWIEKALDYCRNNESLLRGRLLEGAGLLAFIQGEGAAAQAFFQESLEMARRLQDQSGIATALLRLGNVAFHQGAYETARPLMEESLRICRDRGELPRAAKVLQSLAGIAVRQGDLETARRQAQESREIYRKIEDQSSLADSLVNVAVIARLQGDYEEARALNRQGLQIFRELDDRPGMARALGNLGNLDQDAEDAASAYALHQESLAIQRELGHKQAVAISLYNLGLAALDLKNHPEAEALFKESLALCRTLRDRLGVVYALESLAFIATDRGDPPRAARFVGAAEAQRDLLSAPIPPLQTHRADAHRAVLRTTLGDEAFDAALEEGRAMTWEEAAEYALAP